MKILFLHSEDDLEQGPWASSRWDRVVDLGRGGAGTYERWSKRFACTVEPVDSLRGGFDDFRQVRELLGQGCGQLVDEYGLDWWEIMSILLTGEVETLILLQRMACTIGAGDELHVSRPGFHADILRLLLGGQVRIVSGGRDASRRKLSPTRYWKLSTRLSSDQIVDIFWNKYDPGYQLRGRLPGRRRSSTRPVILLPTAYVNVSRTAIEYANAFPDENFLLVATRRSGWMRGTPSNVEPAWLSSYASVRDRAREHRQMQGRWESLLRKATAVRELNMLERLGQLASFPGKFRHGYEVRDAWLNVLDREPVQAVLCADDSNPYTRIPLLLARERGLPNIATHHGALDGRYLYKRAVADVIWAKGKMEEDYLVRVCGVAREKVELAAPVPPVEWSLRQPSAAEASQPQICRSDIVFFSELYESMAGRPEEFYRDVLPRLADVALAAGRELVVKLHPAESVRERTRMVDRVLSAPQRYATRVVSGPLTENQFSKTWFGVTILSTVAMECAIRGIPCFLCKWLEFSHHGYVDQFIRFGVGTGLESAEDIKGIPQYLRNHMVSAGVRTDCWQPVAPGRLRELLATPSKPCTVAAAS
jgi:hypothetical protein